MAAVYRFLSSYEGLVYLVLAIGGVIALRWLWSAWREWREAIFGLEREFAQRRLNRALAISFVILLLALGEFILASFVVPALPATVFMPTATLNILATPTGTLPAELATALAVAPATSTAESESGCMPGRLNFTSPKPGQELSGIIELMGTVNIPNFGFYKYEVAPLGSDTWATISAGREVVREDTLGRWDTTEMTPGDYNLRLVVTDNQGESLPACIIPVRVAGQ